MTKGNIHKELCATAEALLVRFADGRVVASALSDRVDDLISRSYHISAGAETPGLALVAVGGYGRREQSAFSDVDIMLLGSNDDRRTRELAEKALYSFWDLGLQLSHSFRTVKSCVSDALKDLQIRTALMEARYIAGDTDCFSLYQRDAYQRILYKDKQKFLGELLREIDRRHKKYGDSLYLLEPNVKEGQGALRDVHSASWLSRSNLSMDLFREFRTVFPNRSMRDFLSAIAFLLRVRSALHCISGRKNDVLSFEFQGRVAERLGFHDTKAYLAPELLLRVYYRKAQVVAETLKNVMHLCGKRYFQLPVAFGVKKLGQKFALARNELIIREVTPQLSLEMMVEACSHFAATGKPFSHHLAEQIRQDAAVVKTPAVFPQGVLRSFWAIMRSERVHETLAEMHRLRLLEKLLPEFGRLRNLVIFEIYHRYTVDEHTLIAIRNAEQIRQSRDAGISFLREFFASLKPELFFFALLVHDIGKGISRRHEGIGYRMLKAIQERFAIAPEDGARIAFLVKNHIVFSSLALRRDPESPETIHQLAEIVENEENLNALYLMTYADMSAVKPDFWTEWKAYLFRMVYRKTRDVLRGVEADRPRITDPTLLAFVETMPERYRLSHPLAVIEADFRMLEEARNGRLVTSFADRADGTEEVTIISCCMPRIFARIVGVLSCRGLNIAQARLYTSPDGTAIRKLIISNWSSLWWDGLKEQINQDLLEGIGGTCQFVPERHDRSGLLAARRYEIFAEIDNEGSGFFTILELHFPDRLGLLYDITTMLYDLGIDISAAVINTDEDMAEDIFYLHRRGEKLGAEEIWHLLGAVWNSEFGSLQHTDTQ